jgi:hypothetical protein
MGLRDQVPDVRVIFHTTQPRRVEVILPPSTLLWLEDRGLGIEALQGLLREIPEKLTPEPVTHPAVQAVVDDFQAIAPSGGGWNQYGPLRIEAWLKENPGARRLAEIVGILYGVPETEAYRRLYERRGTKQKLAGTAFYKTFRKDLVAALQALAVQGHKTMSAGADGSRLWGLMEGTE